MSPLLSLIAMLSHQMKPLKPWKSLVLLLVSIGCSTYPSLRGGSSKSNNIYCNAQLLNAYDQAYGLWNIKLNKHLFARRRWHVDTTSSVLVDNNDGSGSSGKSGRKRGKRKIASGDLQLMFPNIIQSMENRDNNNGDDTKRDSQDVSMQSHSTINEQQQLQTTTTMSKPVKSIQCILNLERSGKFTLSLVDENDRHQRHQHKTKISLDDNVHRESQSSTSSIATASSDMVSSNKHQPLQGEWYLTPNPYCVTDRQYDTLLLVSEPRMRRIRSQYSSKRLLPTLSRLLSFISSAQSSSSMVIERATVELRCKLYGRYSMGSIRNILGMKHGRSCGRMVCGSIVIVKEVLSTDGDDDESIKRRRVWKKEKTREVIGTFSGRTIVDDMNDDMGITSRNSRVNEDEIEDEDESDFEHF